MRVPLKTMWLQTTGNSSLLKYKDTSDTKLSYRWGYDTRLTHGGFYCGPDRYNPGTLQEHKWENAMTVDTVSWGVRRDINLRAILSMDQLLTTVIETISCGGNMLINVGPTKEGNIMPIFQERLKSLGDWLKVSYF